MPDLERVVLIGCGRFGRVFKKNYEKVFKKRIFYVYDKKFKRKYDKEKLLKSDIIIVSVNDDSIEDILKSYSNLDKEFIIVSGSFDYGIAKKYLRKAKNISIFHPIQSFTRGDKSEIFKNIYATVESTKNSKFIKKFCKLNDIKLFTVRNPDRKKYHLSMMLTANYTLTLIALSEILLYNSTSLKLKTRPFIFLLRSLLDKLETKRISQVITGPSVRGDLKLINKIAANIQDKELKKLFLLLDRKTRELFL